MKKESKDNELGFSSAENQNNESFPREKSGMSAKRKAWIYSVRALMTAATGITLALALFLVVYVLAKGLPNLSFELLTTAPSYLSGRVGILPDILNSLYIVFATLIIVLPLGVGSAVYLTEYARNKLFRQLNMRRRHFPVFRQSFTDLSGCCFSANLWDFKPRCLQVR